MEIPGLAFMLDDRRVQRPHNFRLVDYHNLFGYVLVPLFSTNNIYSNTLNPRSARQHQPEDIVIIT